MKTSTDHPGAANDAVTTLARVANMPPNEAARLLARYGSLRALRGIDASTLRVGHGLTARQATRLSDAFALAACLIAEPAAVRPRVACPSDVARIVLPAMGLLEAEQMRVLALDTKSRLMADVTLYLGTIDACQVRMAEVFREATRRNAASIVLVHNHPSGDRTPSPEDIAVTRSLIQAGRLLDITVADHLIVAGDGYTSLRECGAAWD